MLLPKNPATAAQVIRILDSFAQSLVDEMAIDRAAKLVGTSTAQLENMFEFDDIYGLIGCIVGTMLPTDADLLAVRQYLEPALIPYVWTEAEVDAIDLEETIALVE